MSGPVEDGTLENLNGLLADYNVTVTNGIVVEGDRDPITHSRLLTC